jgi:hypothetical protein
MNQTVTKIKASKVVLDYDIYPRQDVQSYSVHLMVEALRAGAVLPPIIIAKKSKRVIDGFHRVKAYQKLYGPDTDIPAIFKEYMSDDVMFAEAIDLNSKHGRNLTPYDRARCLARAEELKIAPAVVAKALNMTVEALGRLKAERLGYFQSRPIVLKRTTAHLAGEELTEEQFAYNRQAGGMQPTFYINQIVSMLEADAVDWEDEKVVRGLKRLRELLDKVLEPVKL